MSENQTLDFFYMPTINYQFSCGTAGCLLGFARQEAGDVSLFYEHLTEFNAVSKLFMYQVYDFTPENVTTAHATQALHNYLTTGHANWASILPDSARIKETTINAL